MNISSSVSKICNYRGTFNVLEVSEDLNLLARSDIGKAVGLTMQRYIKLLK